MKKLIAISTLMFASTAALAQADIITALDADKDGLVSIEEAKADTSLSTAFEELDVNQDGYLSSLELTEEID
ncbi:MAG: Ca2+-binding EF-hand superfamily protein [Paraglaciecola sp.]|jgi:Ca2+-binding EF-hand superfamily protein